MISLSYQPEILSCVAHLRNVFEGKRVSIEVRDENDKNGSVQSNKYLLSAKHCASHFSNTKMSKSLRHQGIKSMR